MSRPSVVQVDSSNQTMGKVRKGEKKKDELGGGYCFGHHGVLVESTGESKDPSKREGPAGRTSLIRGGMRKCTTIKRPSKNRGN